MADSGKFRGETDFDISVIICTHNPREDYLRRTLEALQNQSLPRAQWEMLLVDNASTVNLSGKWDLGWHPHGRHVREEELGLTPARLRGIRESAGGMLVFVDDDNVLNPDYLQRALEISNSHPWIGAFGGSTIGEYEIPPPDVAVDRLMQLAVRKIERSSWACLPGTKSLVCAPCGAGMVVCRKVADHYASSVASDEFRKLLDRRGNSLASGGDSDIAYCACELGLAVGLFSDLSLSHLIPAGRLDAAYLVRIAEEMSYSHAILRYRWDGIIPDDPGRPVYRGKADQLFRLYQKIRSRLRASGSMTFGERVTVAEAAGLQRARRDVIAHASNEAASESGMNGQ